MSPIFLKSYLKSNPEFLEQILLDEDILETSFLEQLIVHRTPKHRTSVERQATRAKWRYCANHATQQTLPKDLTEALLQPQLPSNTNILWELSSCICSAIGGDDFRLFLISPTNTADNLTSFLSLNNVDADGQPEPQRMKKKGSHLAQFVAGTRNPIQLSRKEADARFPVGNYAPEVTQILCQALIPPNGELVAVLEVFRHGKSTPFNGDDEDMAYWYLVWGLIAVHYAQLMLNMHKQKKVNDFLLVVIK